VAHTYILLEASFIHLLINWFCCFYIPPHYAAYLI